MTRNEKRDWIGQCMYSKGFHDPSQAGWPGALVRATLIGTEASEVAQEFKRNWVGDGTPELKLAVAKEIADVLIRLYDFAYCHGIKDLDGAEPSEQKVPKTDGLSRRDQGIVLAGWIGNAAGELYRYCEYLMDPAEADFYQDEHREVLAGVHRDVIDRCEVVAAEFGLDPDEAIRLKMVENMARPNKYGTPFAGVDHADSSGKPFSFAPTQVPAE
jgi:NTP pyrophosphatase (non-canonical NTP hydrolase)